MEPLTVQLSSRSLTIQLPQEPNPSTFHYVWLRDNCQCDQCTLPTSGQRIINSGMIPLDIKPVSSSVQKDSLSVEWSDGHKSSYPFGYLKKHNYSFSAEERAKRRDALLRPKLWVLEDIAKIPDVDYTSFMENDQSLLDGLRTFLDYGILIIKGLPSELRAVESVCTRIGYIRETYFGRSWDVISKPQAENIAYTSVSLGLHQDLPYFESVPGVQFLHCITQAVEGGASIFVDSWTAAEKLRKEHPKYYETLLRVPMTFQLINNNHSFIRKKPVFYKDENQYIGVNYSPQNHGPLDCPPEDVEAFYEAFAEYSKYVQEPSAVLKRRLEDGEMAMFDNRRVLHGRDSFNPTKGERHLRGCYIDLDDVYDKINVISATIENKSA